MEVYNVTAVRKFVVKSVGRMGLISVLVLFFFKVDFVRESVFRNDDTICFYVSYRDIQVATHHCYLPKILCTGRCEAYVTVLTRRFGLPSHCCFLVSFLFLNLSVDSMVKNNVSLHCRALSFKCVTPKHLVIKILISDRDHGL